MLLNETFEIHYSLKTLIFINSASHAYSEIALDNHLAMFGKNNLGKTASLSATKLLLYPETNFNNCETKFNFVSKSGKKFKKQESYDYYFPTPQSFLMMEAQNPLGSFCMILYKTNNYQYHRVLLPVSYDVIRPYFWDEVNENFADTLNIDTIHRLHKKYHGLNLSDKKAISEILFGNYNSANAQYCLVPLKDNNEASIQAFRGIYELAFNAGKGEETSLPQAIATIIEMGRGRSQERLDADFTQLQTDYLHLQQESDRLKRYRNHQAEYDTVKQRFDQLSQRFHDYSIEYAVLQHWLQQAQSQYSEQEQYLSQKLTDLHNQQYPLSERLALLEKQETELTANQKTYQNKLATHEQEIQAIQTLASEHSGSIERATLALQYQLQTVTELLEGIDNFAQLEHSLKQANQQKQANDNNLQQLQHAKDNHAQLMLNQFSADTASILYSLNIDFASLTTPLSFHDSQTLQAFVQLFDTQHGKLRFAEQIFPNTPFKAYDPQANLQHIEQQIETLKQTQTSLAEKIKQFVQAIKESNSKFGEQKKSTLQKTQITLQKNLDLLAGYDYIQREISTEQQQLATIAEQLSKKSADFHTTNEQYLRVSEQSTSLNTQLEAVKRTLSQFDTKQAFLHRAQRHLEPIYISETDSAFVQRLAEYSEREPDYEVFDALEKAANAIKEDKLTLKQQLQQLMQILPLDSIDPHKEFENFAQYGQIIQAYHNTFSSLPFQQTQHENKIRHHNQYLTSMIQEIKDAHNLLKTRIDRINRELSQHAISNFTAVRLKLTTHADFEALLHDCEKYSEQQDSLMESSFYTRLIDYIKDNSTPYRKLKLENLIKSIHYEYIDSAGEVETKPQSGGTTSTVTAFIISILLDEILREDYTFKMPVIVDEIADIDKDNIATIVSQISSAGFSIFCATPHRITPVCQSVGKHIDIDYCKFDKPRISEKCVLHILPKHINTFGKKHAS